MDEYSLNALTWLWKEHNLVTDIKEINKKNNKKNKRWLLSVSLVNNAWRERITMLAKMHYLLNRDLIKILEL